MSERDRLEKAAYDLAMLQNLHKTDEERTQQLLEYGQKANDEGTAFLVISRRGSTAHALVGIGMISGQWEFDGIAYDSSKRSSKIM